MGLEIPDDVLSMAGLTADELRLEVAIVLFQRERLTLGQASELAGLTQLGLQRVLADRHIPIHYDESDFQEDLDTLARQGHT
jgi:predicted HTH domain antitoxin